MTTAQIDGLLHAHAHLICSSQIADKIARFVVLLKEHKAAGKKLILAGNGASASISSHLATDFTKQAGIRAVAFNDANLITALGNDCGYEQWIAKALDLYADPGDLLVLISSSGSSRNIIQAATRAKLLGLTVVAFTGFSQSNPLSQLADHNFWVESRSYNAIECVHMTWLATACDALIGKSEYSVAG